MRLEDQQEFEDLDMMEVKMRLEDSQEFEDLDIMEIKMRLEDSQELEELELQESKEDLQILYQQLSKLKIEEDSSLDQFKDKFELQDFEMEDV